MELDPWLVRRHTLKTKIVVKKNRHTPSLLRDPEGGIALIGFLPQLPVKLMYKVFNQ